MAEINPKLRIGLYNALNVSAVTTLATGGIHWKLAPESASYPFLVFDGQSAVSVYALTGARAGEHSLWTLTAYADEDSSTTKEPFQVCEDIIDAALTAIASGVTVSGFTCSKARKSQDIFTETEGLTDRPVFRHTVQLDVFCS